MAASSALSSLRCKINFGYPAQASLVLGRGWALPTRDASTRPVLVVRVVVVEMAQNKDVRTIKDYLDEKMPKPQW